MTFALFLFARWLQEPPCWLPEGCPLPIEGPIIDVGMLWLPVIFGG